MPNRLSRETSPYLRQHADDPVDWYPWGSEALAAALTLDRPIFLSVGYASCHWCHVMQRESFADPTAAALLNAHFTSIKVDREERPDVDAVYLQAVTALTGSAGWPLSVWLTPEGKPFFGGTYFPPESRFGRPSFRQVLNAIAEFWRSRRTDLLQAAERLGEQLARDNLPQGWPCPIGDIISRASAVLLETFDPMNGGWGEAPKFPQPLVIDFLLALQEVEPRPDLERAVTGTLDVMASGGLYDHLGGGFHRYCVDESWRVPHFEKMLYDNAQLARCYLHAWQATGKALYRQVATETLDYLARDMRDPTGGFYGSEDADSEGREGAFYTWTPLQLRQALGASDAKSAAEFFGVTPEGHLEGASVLCRTDLRGGSPMQRAISSPPDALGKLKAKLLEARNHRLRPFRDEKLLAGWNGLALTAFAEAATALHSAEYLECALGIGRFTRDELWDDSGALAHSLTRGQRSGEAFLDGYACVAEGLLSLYQATFDESWFSLARDLCERASTQFCTPGRGFFDTGRTHEVLLMRPRSRTDSPTPAGLSATATVFLKLAAYTGEDKYSAWAAEALEPMVNTAMEEPVLAGRWLTAALLAHRGLTEVAVVGAFEDPTHRRLLDQLWEPFHPFVIGAARRTQQPTMIAILRDREPGPENEVAAWVCNSEVCNAATSDPAVLASLLGRHRTDYQREPPEREPPP